ncbi:hypothetical protein E9993_04970 [Labilibacter sediminis]|nr:hypothetical protein E9993_04970 [Labilibacter sediminis]
MKKIFLFIAAVLVVASCKQKELNLYPSFEESASMTIDETGSFEEEGAISASDIHKAIDELDLDEDGSITDVSVEGIWIVIEQLQGNTAQSFNLDIVIDDWMGGEKYILDDFEVNIPPQKSTINFPKKLKKEGVLELNRQLIDIILMGGSRSISFTAEGDAIPEGSMIKVRLELYVKGSVVFTQIVDLF